jgi:hypothetical protein
LAIGVHDDIGVLAVERRPLAVQRGNRIPAPANRASVGYVGNAF